MRPVDTITTILPFVVILIFEVLPKAVDDGEPGEDGGPIGLRSVLSLESQFKKSLQELETRNYEILDPCELDYVVKGELRTQVELDPENFENLLEKLTTSIQTQVRISVDDIVSLTREHLSYVNDRIQVVVGGGATAVSFAVVLFSRRSSSSLPLSELFMYMFVPVAIFTLITTLLLYFLFDSPLEYRSVRARLGISPASLTLIAVNIGICIGIVILDVCFIGYN